MRKFLLGAILIVGASAFVTGSSHSPTHNEQKSPPAALPKYDNRSDVIQVPAMAMAPEAIQAIRYDLSWCTVKNVATAIDSPIIPVQEVANGPPVASAASPT